MNAGPKSSLKCRLLFALLFLALAASVVCNFYLFGKARSYYSQELFVRLHPVSNAVRISGSLTAPRVLFLGDSRIADWPALPADRFCTVNAGVGGETTAQIRLRAAAVLDTQKPDVVVIEAGINDLKAIGVFPDAAQSIANDCSANLINLVNLSRERHARVILLLIIPASKVPLSRRPVWSSQIDTAVASVNDLLAKTYTGNKDVIVFAPVPLFPIDHHTGRDDSAYRDTMHLTTETYEKINASLLRQLDSMSLTNHAEAATP